MKKKIILDVYGLCGSEGKSFASPCKDSRHTQTEALWSTRIFYVGLDCACTCTSDHTCHSQTASHLKQQSSEKHITLLREESDRHTVIYTICFSKLRFLQFMYNKSAVH